MIAHICGDEDELDVMLSAEVAKPLDLMVRLGMLSTRIAAKHD
jgi:hypothetical protein